MAMKDLLDRFKREPEEELPEELPVEEKTSFVFTDINSEPIDPVQETAPEAPAHSGPVKVGSSDNDRIQVFELDLGGSKNKAPAEPEATLTYEPPVYEAPVEEPPVVAEPEGDDTIVVAPTPVTADASEDYEVDFGYAAPGALDDVTYTTDPASVPKPAAPEPVVYKEEPAADNGEEEYYDSYEPIFEESYGPGTYFAGNSGRAPAEEPAAPVEEPEETVEPATYVETEERPRYENYRKDYMEDSDGAPRSYENNIDDSVFLPDEEEAPFSSKRNRRRLTVAIIAVLAALLLVLGGVLISHFAGRSSNKDAELATSSKVKTTAFERSVSNNADATETTTEEASAEYDDEGRTSASSTSATSSSSTQSTSRRSSTGTTTSRSTTTRSTTSRTTTSRTTTTSATTTAPTTQPSTAPPSTDPVTEPPTQGPSPWDRVNP